MKIKYILLVSCLIIFCLGWMAFANAEKEQKGTEEYVLLVVDIEYNRMGKEKTDINFSVAYFDQAKKETISADKTQIPAEIIKRIKAVSEEGYSLVTQSENRDGISLQKTFTFKKTE